MSTRDDAISEALTLLSYVDSWELAAGRWAHVHEIVNAMATALDDDDRLREATIDLAFAGPVRATRLGATPVVPPPPVIRERVNRLVHELRLVRDHHHDTESGGAPDGRPRSR